MILFCQRCSFPADKKAGNTTGSIGKRNFFRPLSEWRRNCFASCLSVCPQGPLYRAPAVPPFYTGSQLPQTCSNLFNLDLTVHYINISVCPQGPLYRAPAVPPFYTGSQLPQTCSNLFNLDLTVHYINKRPVDIQMKMPSCEIKNLLQTPIRS